MRTWPEHLYISLDLLESIHFVSAMFSDIPIVVIHGEERWNLHRVNRSFGHVWDTFNADLEKGFVGPPQKLRDYIVAAAMRMRDGDWKQCNEYVQCIDAFLYFLDMKCYDRVKEVLQLEIKKQSLRCWLVKNGPKYVSITMDRLVQLFDLRRDQIIAFITEFMSETSDKYKLTNKFRASFDACSDMLIIHNAPVTHVQNCAVDYADKLELLVMSNEELVYTKIPMPTEHNRRTRMGNRGRMMIQYSQYQNQQNKGGKGHSGGHRRNNHNNNRNKQQQKPSAPARRQASSRFSGLRN